MTGGLEAARRELAERVMGKPGVAGTAVGEHRGKPCLTVYVTGEEVGVKLPKEVGGFPVRVERSGRFRKL